VIGAALAAPAPARADEPAPAGADEPPEVAEIGVRGSLAITDHGGFGFAGVSGLYHVYRHVALGGYLEGSLVEDPMGDYCWYEGWGCPDFAWRVGAMARVDVLPTFVLDPWVGLGLGTFWAHSRVEGGSTVHGRAELEGTVGLDVRVPRVSFGPYGLLVLSLDPEAPGFGALGYGLRVAVRF